MAHLDHIPDTGCLVLKDEVVYFKFGMPGRPGDTILVTEYQGQVVVVTKLQESRPGDTKPGYTYARFKDTPENHMLCLPLVGVVTRRVPIKTPGEFPIAADLARGLSMEANQGDRLRQRIKDLIVKATGDGRHSISVELRNTPDDDRRALVKELWDAGFAVDISERPIQQIAYGDEEDVYLLSCSWAMALDAKD